MFKRFQQQIADYLPQQQAFTIALSGGVDSIVLLHLFAELQRIRPLELRVIHVHHGLSPNADYWANFCQKTCQKLQLPITVERVKIAGQENIEAQAREARYQAIRQHLTEEQVVVAAHHLDDQAETFLLALKRGSGVKGLAAMSPLSTSLGFRLFRPLLSFSKAELTAYAQAHQLNWIEDESNQSDNFDRNFLRQSVLPKLNQRWQHFNVAVARCARHCAEQQQLLADLLNDTLKQYEDIENKRLSIADFPTFSPLKQKQLVRLWLEKCGEIMPTANQLEQIIQRVVSALPDKNPEFHFKHQVLRRYQQSLFLTPRLVALSAFEAEIPNDIWLCLPDTLGELQHQADQLLHRVNGVVKRWQLPKNVENQPLVVKLAVKGKVALWQKSQREEIKKVWQENHIPPWLRSRTPLIFCQDQLLMLLKLPI